MDTHWEILKENKIGESGVSLYYLKDPQLFIWGIERITVLESHDSVLLFS